MCAAAFIAACDTDKNGDELPGEGLHGLLQGARLGIPTSKTRWRRRARRAWTRKQCARRRASRRSWWPTYAGSSDLPCSSSNRRPSGSTTRFWVRGTSGTVLRSICSSSWDNTGLHARPSVHRGARMVVFMPRRAAIGGMACQTATGNSPWRVFGRAVTCRCSSRQSR